ncbi:MAG: hypothetical protein R3F24_10290 [Gammaproteobacteria bacterium]
MNLQLSLLGSLGLALVMTSQIASGSHRQEMACTRTASAAHAACIFEVLDDFWIETGKCKNFADASDRQGVSQRYSQGSAGRDP